MTFEQLKERALALPAKPGVYIMQDTSSTVIYVGKAKALKSRVSQYFQDAAGHSVKTRIMVSNIDHFDVIIAESEFEALVLECSLIKRHQPRYNILLKDSKGYPYVKLDLKEEYPVFSMVGKADDSGARFFGPYGGRRATDEMLTALGNALHLPTCGKKFPRDIGKERPCLNFHMGKCEGYCRPETEPARHRAAIDQAVRLLEGKLGEVTDELRSAMEAAAAEMRFERAAQLRDQLRAIEVLSKRQKVIAASLADTDVIGYHKGHAKSCFVVLHYIGGELAAKDVQLLDHPLEEALGEVISALAGQYYGRTRSAPRRIILPCPMDDAPALARLLTENTGHPVRILAPKSGPNAALVRLANTNAAEEALRETTREERQSKLIEALGRLLGLDVPPNRIEAFDISNTGASNIVASMTVFEQGKPKKKDFRHYKIKTLTGPDDYHAMEEVLRRRFIRLTAGDDAFGKAPDLLLIDGGENHAKIARRVTDELGCATPAFGMVKDARHRTRALVSPDGQEIGIAQIPALFALIGQIQEETHRFAIEFHRAGRAKDVKKSALDEIGGVGPARRNQLLKHFKSVRAIRAASLDELRAVVPKNTAEAVFYHFHHEEEKPCE